MHGMEVAFCTVAVLLVVVLAPRGYYDGASAFAAVAASVSAAVATTISNLQLSPNQAEFAMLDAVMRAHFNWRTASMAGTDAARFPDAAMPTQEPAVGVGGEEDRSYSFPSLSASGLSVNNGAGRNCCC